ncbi:hypothetical protein MMYC01_200248 [Madurella mycetomatis]|uniref:Uncharacterized protein n=1 Tax=Madurella mycetomatis TaxID=100816 RepID=A0A175WJR6_9PEZI|nr:hypothetical protein MMYC01_200248 [Madurella mycetomatis]
MLSILPPVGELNSSSLAIPGHHHHQLDPGHPPSWILQTQPRHDIPQSPNRRSHFLILPLEIRLLIYTHLLALYPMLPRDLSPGYPVPRSHRQGTTYFLLRSGLHPRPTGYIPSSLLRTCRQIYAEARLLPFRENEFVFVSWFFSGLSAARAFVKGLAGWQRDGMRFARLEIKVRDLVCAGEGRVDMWEELCGFWREGLQGLRVKIEVEDLVASGPGMKREIWGHPRIWESERDEDGEGDMEMGGVPWRWVDCGLRRLRALKIVEVELAGPCMEKLGDEGKAEWCGQLSERLNEGRREWERTVVLCASSVIAERAAGDRACEGGK